MTTHPVQFRVEAAPRMQRVHVAMRLVLLIALAMIGCSSAYPFLYLALPATAAVLIARNGPRWYVVRDAQRIVPILRWLAGAYAYLWLLTDVLPGSEGEAPVELQIEPEGEPTIGSALLRLLYSIPALLLLAVLSLIGAVLWLIGAAAILVREEVPEWIGDYLSLALRYQFRLLAYHLSLVDRYPSLEEPASHDVPHSV